MNAGEILKEAQEFPGLAEAIADCSLVVGTTSLGHRELQHPLLRLESAGGMLARHLSSEPAALLFGSEKFGLSNDDLSYCHWLLRIGTRQEHGSMNLGQAVAVCLYELSRKRVVKQPDSRAPAKSEDLERITNSLIETLQQAGYVHSESTPSKIRRLVRRMRIEAHDAEVWLGILRQIRWKLEQQATAGAGDILRPSDESTTSVRPGPAFE